MDAGERQHGSDSTRPVELDTVDRGTQFQHLFGHTRWCEQTQGAGIDCQGLRLWDWFVQCLNDSHGAALPCQEERCLEANGAAPTMMGRSELCIHTSHYTRLHRATHGALSTNRIACRVRVSLALVLQVWLGPPLVFTATCRSAIPHKPANTGTRTRSRGA
jgi:hypothetical protein